MPASEIEDSPDPATFPVLHPGIPFAVHTWPGAALTVRTGGGALEGAAFRPADPALEGYVILDFAAFDAWYEEDEPIISHPHDPFKRIDVRRSTRHVRIELDGQPLAESRRPMVLFETGLPVRYYLPREDVRVELLRPSATRTTCAYKGHASYWSVELPDRTVDDLVWSYDQPLSEVAEVAGLFAFLDERVDVMLDGQPQPRPRTVFG